MALSDWFWPLVGIKTSSLTIPCPTSPWEYASASRAVISLSEHCLVLHMLSLSAPLGAGWMRLERKGRGMVGWVLCPWTAGEQPHRTTNALHLTVQENGNHNLTPMEEVGIFFESGHLHSKPILFLETPSSADWSCVAYPWCWLYGPLNSFNGV